MLTVFPTPSNALHPGTELQNGHYRIECVIGKGGNGIVYLATDTHAQRPVAIKEFFPPHCQRVGSVIQVGFGIYQDEYEEAKKSFLEEVRLLGQLRHLHIVTLFTSLAENGTAYSVMECIPAKTLQTIIEEQTVLPENQVIKIGKRIGAALEHMHTEGILHLDISPANILLEDARPVLIDFGSAREIITKKSMKTRMLVKSALVPPAGTPSFASPNHYKRYGQMSNLDDIYQLAATLYYLLTGKEPTGADARECGVPLPTPRELNPRISQAVNDAVLQAMSLDENARPDSAAAFASLLNKAAAQSITQPPRFAPQVSAKSPQAAPKLPVQVSPRSSTAVPTPVYFPPPAPMSQPSPPTQSHRARSASSHPVSKHNLNWLWTAGVLVVLAIYLSRRSSVQSSHTSSLPAPQATAVTTQSGFSEAPSRDGNARSNTRREPVAAVPPATPLTTPFAKPLIKPVVTGATRRRRARREAAEVLDRKMPKRVVETRELDFTSKRRKARRYQEVKKRVLSASESAGAERRYSEPAKRKRPLRQREEQRRVQFEADLPPSDPATSIRTEAGLPP